MLNLKPQLPDQFIHYNYVPCPMQYSLMTIHTGGVRVSMCCPLWGRVYEAGIRELWNEKIRKEGARGQKIRDQGARVIRDEGERD
jgi:hypothetical protein